MLSLEETVDAWYYFLTLECPYGSIGSIWLANTHPVAIWHTSRGLTLCLLDRNHTYYPYRFWIANHMKSGHMGVECQSKYSKCFSELLRSPSDWLVMFQQGCSIITLVDAITTAWEH